MGYNGKTYKEAKDILIQRKLKAEMDAERKVKKLYEKMPEIKELKKQIASTNIKAAKAVIGGKNVVEEMEKLKKENLSMQHKIDTLMQENGLNKEMFKPKYYCTKCNDTGYIEKDGKTIMCSCFKNALVMCACRELNHFAPLSLSTFDSFSLDYYPKEYDQKYNLSVYEHMKKLYDFCVDYAKNFNKNSISILMKGNTGLGKTHLSLAIANEVIRKGFGVIYVSAPSLVNKLEKNYFSNSNESDDTTSLLTTCDLLIIDDLGTEFHTQYSVSALYNIINSRMLFEKPTIINTNFSMRELEKQYTDRFVSRINGHAQKLDFLGSDIRIRKNEKI